MLNGHYRSARPEGKRDDGTLDSRRHGLPGGIGTCRFRRTSRHRRRPISFPRTESSVRPRRLAQPPLGLRRRSASSSSSSVTRLIEMRKFDSSRWPRAVGKSTSPFSAAARKTPRVPVVAMPRRAASSRPAASSINKSAPGSDCASEIAARSPGSRCSSPASLIPKVTRTSWHHDGVVELVQELHRADERQIVQRRAIGNDNGHRLIASAVSLSLRTSDIVTSRNTP